MARSANEPEVKPRQVIPSPGQYNVVMEASTKVKKPAGGGFSKAQRNTNFPAPKPLVAIR